VIDVAALFHPDYQWHAFANIWQTPGDGEKYFADTLAAPVESRAQLYESVGMTPEVAKALGEAIALTHLAAEFRAIARTVYNMMTCSLGARQGETF
jgi:hypothetical protein